MPDPLRDNGDPLAGQQLAMADIPPEVPPSGKLPAGKPSPAQFLFPMREPPSMQGGALRAEPLQLVPIKRASTGRAMQTEPLRTGREQAVLEAGAENLARGPTAQDWLKLQKIVERNSFPGDELHSTFTKIYDAVRSGVPFRHAMLQHGSEDLLEAVEKVLKKDRAQLGLGYPENLPWPEQAPFRR